MKNKLDRIKLKISNLASSNFTSHYILMAIRNTVLDRGFYGWDMLSAHYTPWDKTVENNAIGLAYTKTAKMIWNMLESKNFILDMYSGISRRKMKKIFSGHMWRHFNVYWSVKYAQKTHATGNGPFTMVECGVCDGLTLMFALEACDGLNEKYISYAYDAWDKVRNENLLDSEHHAKNGYDYLNLENTQRNLSKHSASVVFNKGYIPESFLANENPNYINWLHIDLNSALATEESLKFCFDRLVKGGVILFDDYGWHGYEDTRKCVDNFFSTKPGILYPMPTGQAIFYKI